MTIDLAGRDALADYDHVVSDLVWEHVPTGDMPEISIAIPTFRRPDVLREAVASGLNQDCGQICEIVIVDNDPAGTLDDELIALVTAQRRMTVRYYRNRENIGMFGNWNRTITVGRGAWMTLLNDDDLLAPDFISRSLATLAKAGGGEAIVCRADSFDRRIDHAAVPSGKIDASAARSPRARLRSFLRFGRHGVTRLTPRALYFGNEAGNTAGFLFRRDAVVRLGGFLSEESPAADYMLYLRFAIAHRIFLFRPVLAHVGIGENESLRSETLTGFVTILEGARRALAGRHVPAWWTRFNPRLVSNHLADVEQVWQTRLDRREIADALAMTLPPPGRHGFVVHRLLLRAY